MRQRWTLPVEPGRRSAVIGVAALVLIALGLAAFYLIGTHLEAADPPPEPRGDLSARFAPTLTMQLDGETYSYYKNRFTTVLFIGADDVDLAASGGYRTGAQADFLLLLAIDRHTRSVTPIHIDRDTMTDIQVFGAFGHAAGTTVSQLCLAHAFGGSPQQRSENTAWAVSHLLGGIAIDEYLTLDMAGIALLNDALGGVTVTLEDDFSHLDPAMTKGSTLTLQGRQAEYYVRGRHGVGDATNRQRMSRQRTFLDAAITKLREKSAEDAAFSAALFDELSPHMVTTLTDTWVIDHMYMLTHYQLRDILSLPGAHQVGEGGFMEFYPDEGGLCALLADVFYQQ